ncbi:hypothetical protein [Rhizobium laguerreae]|uniref:hypothetical protein n=1 Tax=Rhizobium laguerreae TaxID=1076926 RepID=UPI001C90BDEC|nr:hypothetical protein [Rhizobium laguerreae]MBY3252590.1 hypothetical protein [Rhizobium laguerreae]
MAAFGGSSGVFNGRDDGAKLRSSRDELKVCFGPKRSFMALESILTAYYGKDKFVVDGRVGNDGLGDAVRFEKATGQLLSDTGHTQKAIDVRRRLKDLIRNADNQPPGSFPYTQRDIEFANELVKDLDDALKR